MKKRLLLLFALMIINPFILYAQAPYHTALLQHELNFAIPDIPAFNAMDKSPGNILRPSTLKDFNMSFSDFYNGSQLGIPKTIAVEISPFLLFKSDRTGIQDYKKNRLWYSLKISTAAQTDSTNLSKLAFGARMTLLDKGDLLQDLSFQRKAAGILKQSVDIHGDLVNEFNKSFKPYYGFDVYEKSEIFNQWILYKAAPELNSVKEIKNDLRNNLLTGLAVKPEDYNANVKEIKTLIDYIINLRFSLVEQKGIDPDKEIERLKSEFKAANWNKTKFDLAFALGAQKPDSLAKNVQLNNVNIWATLGLPVGSSSQLLLGFNAASFKPGGLGAREENITAISRFYLGTNGLKGFAEGLYSYEKLEENTIMLNLGAELNIKSSIWLNFSAGIKNNTTLNVSELISSFKLNYALPEEVNFMNND